MAGGSCREYGSYESLWSNLPSIILVEIFSLLNLKDRLNASSVCKAWRGNLFHPRLWHRVVLRLNSSCDRPRCINEGARFLAKSCGRFVREVVLEVNSSNPWDVQHCKQVLKLLSSNSNLRALSIKPLSSRLEWADYNDTLSLDQFVESLLRIVRGSRQLEHLSLGCIEELLDRSSERLLSPLVASQANSLCSLHLASVREVPGRYFVPHLDPDAFQKFRALQRLSIDYDHLTDRLLESLTNTSSHLRQLAVHVHSLRSPQQVSPLSWRRLSQRCPFLEVSMTLLHSQGLSRLGQLVTPEVPVAHFRAFFCPGLHPGSLASLLNDQTLRSLTLVEGVDEGGWPVSASFVSEGTPDALIMLAWKCKKLTDIKIVGYEVEAESLIGISRLRGPQLLSLEVPACCITDERPFEEAICLCIQEVSEALQRPWRPLDLRELPLAVSCPQADADAAYLPLILQDQAWQH